MKKIKIYCKNCNHGISRILEEAKESELNIEEGYNLVSNYSFIHWISSGIGTLRNTNLFTNKEAVHLENHDDESRFVGCCGYGRLNVLNQICTNCSNELATLYEDCLMSHFVAFDITKIIVKDFSNKHNIKKINFKQF